MHIQKAGLFNVGKPHVVVSYSRTATSMETIRLCARKALPSDRQNRTGGTEQNMDQHFSVLNANALSHPRPPRAQAPSLKDLPLQFLDHMRPLAVAGVREPHVAVCREELVAVAGVKDDDAAWSARVLRCPPGAPGGEETRATMPVNGGVGTRRGECVKVAQGSACRGFKVRVPSCFKATSDLLPPASSVCMMMTALRHTPSLPFGCAHEDLHYI